MAIAIYKDPDLLLRPDVGRHYDMQKVVECYLDTNEPFGPRGERSKCGVVGVGGVG